MRAEQHNILLDFTTVLGASALGSYLANSLRQPVFLGYLARGLILGLFGLKLLNDAGEIKGIAAIGIILHSPLASPAHSHPLECG